MPELRELPDRDAAATQRALRQAEVVKPSFYPCAPVHFHGAPCAASTQARSHDYKFLTDTDSLESYRIIPP